jgi:ferredoxin-NADP reductase
MEADEEPVLEENNLCAEVTVDGVLSSVLLDDSCMPDRGEPAHDGPCLYVCIGGACQMDGAGDTLLEIEELCDAVGGGCTVKTEWCFGMCGSGPNVNYVHGSRDDMFSSTRSTEQSISLVEMATGRRANEPALLARLREARRTSELERELDHARLLMGCTDRHQQALSLVDSVIQRAADAHPVLLARQMRKRIVQGLGGVGQPSPPLTSGDGDDDDEPLLERKIVCWRLERVEPVSRHSAVFVLSSQDGARRMKLARGRELAAWHVSMHLAVGEAGHERYIRRDYTPLSTLEEWVDGSLRLLVKIYEQGAATQWLHSAKVGQSCWFSLPKLTLSVPGFRPASGRRSLFSDGLPLGTCEAPIPLDFASVVLIGGGTGITPLYQILRAMTNAEDRELAELPLSLVHSCRCDDTLLVHAIAEGVLHRAATVATITLTNGVSSLVPGPGDEQQSPRPWDRQLLTAAYAESEVPSLAQLRATMPHLTFTSGRVSIELLEATLRGCPRPRIVLSGPTTFMQSVSTILSEHLGVPAASLVSLKA